MKGSKSFKSTIKSFLDNKAKSELLFLKKYKNPDKNLDDCITFIMNTVKSSGNSGFEDSEIYNMAIHYYQEDEIEVGKPIDGNVVVNHHVELTDEEKRKAKDDAIQQLINAEKSKLRKPAITTKPVQDKAGDQIDMF